MLAATARALIVLEHVGAALGVLVVGIVMAFVARWMIGVILRKRAVTLGPSFAQLLSGLVYYGLISLTIGASLVALGVPPVVVAGIWLAILVVLMIALQESVADLAATVKFLMFRPFRRGELIETMEHVGYVQELLPFNTVLLRRDQRLVTLANSQVYEHGIVNHSRLGRVCVTFTLAVDRSWCADSRTGVAGGAEGCDPSRFLPGTLCPTPGGMRPLRWS